MSLKTIDSKELLRKQKNELKAIQHKIEKTKKHSSLWRERLIHPFAFCVYGLFLLFIFAFINDFDLKEVGKMVLTSVATFIGERGIKSLRKSDDNQG